MIDQGKKRSVRMGKFWVTVLALSIERLLGLRWRKRKCRRADSYANPNACTDSDAYSTSVAGWNDRHESPEHQRTSRRDIPVPAFQY